MPVAFARPGRSAAMFLFVAFHIVLLLFLRMRGSRYIPIVRRKTGARVRIAAQVADGVHITMGGTAFCEVGV